jgi:DNA-binding transcriptional MerR regulator
VASVSHPAFLRIGELATRLGVKAPVLRVWEDRYGVVSPTRSSTGSRLYSAADERRLRRMVALIGAGAGTRQAARIVLAEADTVPEFEEAAVLVRLRNRLARALDGFDEEGAQAAMDRLFGSFGLSTALAAVILPYLHRLGARWATGDATVAQEHFATTLVRARLLSLARGWSGGRGEAALLACSPGEQHDIGLICFGLELRRAGWRIVFLGQDAPVAAINEVAAKLPIDLVVLSAVAPALLEPTLRSLQLPAHTAVGIGGAGADGSHDARATVLPDDPIAAARHVALAPTALPRWRDAAGGAAETTPSSPDQR